MSSNPSSQRQPRSTVILPPIGSLIEAANQGMSGSHYQQHPQAHHRHYPPTPPTGMSMYGQNPQLPPLVPQSSHSRSRSRNDPAYPTPPNSARSDRAAAPTTTSSGGNRRHVCSECSQAFDRPSSLQTHMNTHTGEQPFQCPYPGCGRKFSVKSNMRRHLSTHEQPRMTDADEADYSRPHDGEYVFSVNGQR
ncbi:C2H2 zinc finger [Ceratobasidium sp. AG-Ba]|nr:C2H2 zinc finger [Ceratobasidium sp. AG-Ba]QRW02698.1 C2H2 zinc finger [Ceratobasidium sp. AG-Ba]